MSLFSDPFYIDHTEGFMLEEAERLTPALREGAICFDFGAHVGTRSIALAKRGASRVYAFEPSDRNFQRLVANVCTQGVYGKVIPIPMAVAPKTGTATLRRKNSDGQQSIVFREDLQGYEVPTIAFDSALDLGTWNIDYVKMDIEGGEWNVFADLRMRYETPLLRRIQRMDIELHDTSNTDFFSTDQTIGKEALKEFLEAAKFVVTDILNYGNFNGFSCSRK